ncbi:MAG: zinc-ribbon domain-containing protein [Eubacterium sp.]
MFCSKCGQQIEDGVYYCEHCGEAVNRSYTQQPFNTSANGYQSNQQTNSQYTQFAPQAFDYMINSKLEDARTMGILAIILGLFIPIVGIVLGCIGITKINDIPYSTEYNYDIESEKKKAKTLCTVGIVLPIALWILAIIFIFVIWIIVFSSAIAIF